MAELIKTVVDFGDVSKECIFNAASGSDYFSLDNADGRISLLISNTNDTEDAAITVKAGDGKLSSKGDIIVSVAAAKSVVVPMSRLESARVKVTSGDNKGKVLVTSSIGAGGTLANVLVAVISVN